MTSPIEVVEAAFSIISTGRNNAVELTNDANTRASREVQRGAQTSLAPKRQSVASFAHHVRHHPMLVPLMAVFLCLWGVLTQIAVPWKQDMFSLHTQCLAMAAGLSILIVSPRLPLPGRLSATALWSTLSALTTTTLTFAWAGLGRTWYASVLGWLTLSLLVVCALRLPAESRFWRDRAPVCLVWLLLFFASFPGYGVHVILVPLLALAIFLPLWSGRWRLGALIAMIFGLLAALFVGANLWRLPRFIPCLFSPDPRGAQFAALKVRHTLEAAGWTGLQPRHIPFLINGSTHYALGLLGARWGWLGLLLWFSIQAWLIGDVFRVARQHRGQLEGDLLAALSFVILLATVVSVSMALGFAGYGVALPLLGLDPGLAFLELLTLALGRCLQMR